MDDSMPKKLDILLAGVGGQGVVLAGDIISDVAMAAGYDVKKSDTLGMAQRGGSVVAHIRLGDDIASPVIPKGEVDYLLAFEKLEAVRWADYLKTEAIVIYNDFAIPPTATSPEDKTYPSDEQITLALYEHTPDVFALAGTSRANETGNPKTLSVVMLGALSMLAPFSPDAWKIAISKHLPDKVLDVNINAFSAGRKELMRVLAQKAEERELEAAKEAEEHQHEGGCGCG